MTNDLLTPRTASETAALASRLRMAMTRMVRRLRREAGGEHSASVISALATVNRFGAMTLGELAEAEGVSRPSMTVLATNLERAGLIGREPDASDRRLVRVRVSAAGRAVLTRSRTLRNAYLARRLRGLQASELKTLDAAAGILERLLEEGR